MLKTVARLVLIAAALAISFSSTARAGDAPVLAVLEFSGGLLPKRANILAKIGPVQSPFAEPRAIWTLREGDTLRQEHTPPARYIQLFQQSGDAPRLLCNIVVRYLRDPKGWRPAYLLLHQSPVLWDGDKLIPRAGMSTREPVQIVSTTPPVMDGFVHSLSFSLASGPIRISAWEVQ